MINLLNYRNLVGEASPPNDARQDVAQEFLPGGRFDAPQSRTAFADQYLSNGVWAITPAGWSWLGRWQ